LTGETPAPVRTAVIGCGDVATREYIPYLSGSPLVDIRVCADRDVARARAAAERFGLTARSVADAIADPEIEMILDLTPPLAHVSINTAALEAGKHVYTEKPLAATFAEGRRLIALATQHGNRIAGAPDTILGPNLQLARELIDAGRIGTPYMASMSFVTADRSWHPNPEFFYRAGAGPIFDEGPYFLSALVALLSPIAEVTALAATFIGEIPAGEGGSAKTFRPQVPTSYVGGLRLESGVLASLLMSFDVRGTTMPPLEIYGSEGTIRLGFPGHYHGPVLLGTEHNAITEEIPPAWHLYPMDELKIRGLGVEEFVLALRTGEPSRVEAPFALHILEAMEGIVAAAASGASVRLTTRTERPRPYDPRENPRNRVDQM
jgi:predicted dehydrogenase